MTDDTKILYKDYTEEEPYEGDCCPPNYWTCKKGVGITLPEYALSRSLTYEGARRKILKYRDELIPHIRIRSGTQYLDDVAVDFLDRHGRKKAGNSVAVKTEELDELREKIDSLTQENDSLKAKCQDLTDKLEQNAVAYKELYEKYDYQLRRNVELSTELIISDRRSQHVIDTQFDMLRKSGVMTAEKLDIILDAMNWNGLIQESKKPRTPLSLDDKYDDVDDNNDTDRNK